MDFYNSALEINREIGHKGEEAWILDSIALLYMHEEEMEKAREYLEQSAKIGTELMGEEFRSRHLIIMALYYRMIGDDKKASEYFKQTLKEPRT